MGNREFLQQLQAGDLADDRFGAITVSDILLELEKPGRDPRPQFRTAKFKSGVKELRDLREGMILEGVVTNVANFGAFVDIGVHQDGLVHISALTHQFIDDPRKVVRTGEVVQVKVLEVDTKRKRISLTMRMDDPAATREPHAAATGKRGGESPGANRSRAQKQVKPAANRPKTAKDQVKAKLASKQAAPQSALAAAFARAISDQ